MLDVQIDQKQLHELTKVVMELPGLFTRARNSALASLGYHIRQDLKKEPLDPKLSPYTGTLARRHGPRGSTKHVPELKSPRYKTGSRKGLVKMRLSSRSMPFSRLKNMVRYEVDAEDGLVSIGLLKSSAVFGDLMRQHAKGFGIPVTPKMRKMFFALGLPLKKETTRLQVPARPWVRKVEERWRTKATPFFEEKFWEALNRYWSGGSKR